MKAIQLFFPSLKLILKDRVLLSFGLIPPTLGIILYSWFGRWLFFTLKTSGDQLINQYITTGASILSTILVSLLTVLIFFLVNYTFVLVVSILAVPFQDLMSKRTKKLVLTALGKKLDSKEETRFSFSGVMKLMVNESKKMILIAVLSIIAFFLNFIPMLFPVSVMMTSILVAISFLDLSWSHDELTFKECFKDLLKNPFSYFVGGLIFMGIIAIPVVALLALSVGPVYFTYLREELQES